MRFEHISVLLNETISGLNILPEGVYVDGTLGGGGHAFEICKRLNDKGLLIGIDQDSAAITASEKRLQDFLDRVKIHRSNYEQIKDIVAMEGLEKVNGILLDLGVSSHQLDEADRGFTYQVDTSLDMRMDQRQDKTAKDIVNTYDEQALYRLIKAYGEERFAKSIARNIVKERENKPIETTGELVNIIKKSMPPKARFSGGHPAKRTFQAIRIELNKELEVLENSLNTMIDLLEDKGRLCIITFHSLEDRIVKKIFRENEDPCTCPREFPVCVCQKVSKGKVITRKPILPSEDELKANTRSKSAKLRIFERQY